MKILLLNADIGYGGAEKMLAFVANTLSKSIDNQVTFLTYRDNIVKQTLSERVVHHHIQLEHSGGGKGLISTVRCLRKYIKNNAFDVAIAFLSPSQLRLTLACKGTKTKVILSQRGDPYVKAEGIKSKIIEFINNRVFSNADYFVFQTEKARDFYSQKVRKNSAVICNPIVPLIRTSVRDNDTVKNTIVSVARSDLKQKRQDILIDAFCEFYKKHNDYLLELYGDGDDLDLIKEMARKNSNIRVCGATNSVAEKIQNAAMFVLSSDFEGIPNALLEAMSIGVPCISTDCSPGGAALLIKNRETGILVKSGDSKELAEAMSYFDANVDEREKIGQCGMYVNRKFSADNIAEEWIRVVEFVAYGDKNSKP